MSRKHKRAAKRIEKALEILSGPEKWTQGWFARTEGGFTVCEQSEAAVCFCLVGAIQRAGGPYFISETELVARRALVAKVGSIGEWNDTPGRTYEEVIELLKTTKAELEAMP